MEDYFKKELFSSIQAAKLAEMYLAVNCLHALQKEK